MKGVPAMDIYSILASKPHNPHYLNKYITFIKQCQQKNDGYEGVVEKHHICPKADDMFPEFKSFRKYPWNKALLTPRQHFIAHIILYKCYSYSFSVNMSLNMMCNFSKYFSFSKKYEKYKEIFYSKISKHNKGKVVCRDIITGDIYSIEKSVFQNTSNLVGIRKDKVTIIDENNNIKTIEKENYDKEKHHNFMKNRYKAVDIQNRVYYIYEDDHRLETGELVFTNKNKPAVYKYSDDDGNIYFLEEDSDLIQKNNLSKHKKNLLPVKDSKGNFYMVHKNDIRIETGELVHNTKGLVAVKDIFGKTFSVPIDHPDYISGKFVSVNKDKIRVKDKNGNQMLVERNDPRYISGELTFWSKGLFPVKDKHGNVFCVNKEDPRLKNGDLVSIHKGKMLNSKRITNGKANKTISEHAEMPNGWWEGVTGKTTSGTVLYNNGSINKRFRPDEEIPSGWSKGYLKKRNNL
jgi:hypothetical protein